MPQLNLAASEDCPPVVDRLTVAEALDRHGVTWQQLERIAQKALLDGLRERTINLDPARRQEALEHLIEVGARWALRYDPELANGISFLTSSYRRMKPRVTDYLRARHGDERRGTPLHLVSAGDRADFTPDGPRLDEETFEQLIDHVGRGLSLRALRTLRTVAYDVVVLGLERWRVAEKRGIPAGEVTDLLEELGWQLRSRVVPA